MRLAALRVMGVDLGLDISDSLWRHRNIAAHEVSGRGVGAPVEFSGKVAGRAQLGRRSAAERPCHLPMNQIHLDCERDD